MAQKYQCSFSSFLSFLSWRYEFADLYFLDSLGELTSILSWTDWWVHFYQTESQTSCILSGWVSVMCINLQSYMKVEIWHQPDGYHFCCSRRKMSKSTATQHTDYLTEFKMEWVAIQRESHRLSQNNQALRGYKQSWAEQQRGSRHKVQGKQPASQFFTLHCFI